eukprot:1985899-Rhodomonas_salina.1
MAVLHKSRGAQGSADANRPPRFSFHPIRSLFQIASSLVRGRRCPPSGASKPSAFDKGVPVPAEPQPSCQRVERGVESEEISSFETVAESESLLT